MRLAFHSIAVTSLVALASFSAQARIDTVSFGDDAFAYATTPAAPVSKWPALGTIGFGADSLFADPLAFESKLPALGTISKLPALSTAGDANSFATLSSTPSFASSIAPAVTAFQTALNDLSSAANSWLGLLGGLGGGVSNPFAFNAFDPLQPAAQAIAAPIPEPSTYAMMAAGLLGIAFVARRRGTRR